MCHYFFRVLHLYYKSIIKFVELLLIPVSALILGAMLDKEITISDTLSIGITGLICLCFIYGLIIFALYLNDVVMRYPESTYMQLVSDLQSIVDFEECQVLKLVNGCTVIALGQHRTKPTNRELSTISKQTSCIVK